jgi:hypothetical protein
MDSTYKATVRGDRIEWGDDVPEEVRSQPALSVIVTIAEQSEVANKSGGSRMAAALERLAQDGGVPFISDPVQWQRQQREDRNIPGRT